MVFRVKLDELVQVSGISEEELKGKHNGVTSKGEILLTVADILKILWSCPNDAALLDWLFTITHNEGWSEGYKVAQNDAIRSIKGLR